MSKEKVLNAVTHRLKSLILVCFFLSGLTGLIYEILWTRMIVKIIGGAPFAISIVLTVFMGGLGLGSLLAGRFVDRIKDPVRLVKIYGLLELAIGAYGFLLPLLLVACKPLYAVFYNRLYEHFFLYNLFTFAGCAILLCVPITCMGATLPILCRFYVTRLSRLGTHTGRLYGVNTIGAAVGALLTGFWLINHLGVWGTLTVAVLINGMIGLLCIIASSKARSGPGQSRSHARPHYSEKTPRWYQATGHAWTARLALVVFAVSGFCAMAYEVIWTRLLGLIVGPTTYSFTIVLVTFILGLALGSMLFGWLGDRFNSVFWLLIGSQIMAALAVLGISQVLGNSQFFFAKLISQFKDHFVLLSLVKVMILFAFMILPTLCLGATFPLVGKIYTKSLTKVGRSIGFAYAVNTVGAVLGSFCAGFILIPLVGKEHGLSLIIGLQLLCALVVGGVRLLKTRERVLRRIPLVIPALAGLLLCFFFPAWNHSLLSTGKYHRFERINANANAYGWLETLLRGPDILTKSEKGELVYYGEGVGGFTTVTKYIDPLGNTSFTMANSGKADASSHGDMKTQTLSAHLPLLFHRDAQKVMVLGLASGITAGEVLHYPVQQLDVLDINYQVVEASDYFRPWNNNVLDDPRTKLIIQDGRAHLNLTKQRYDVIISEPSNPWMAGLAALFTHDFFALARDKLNQGGIFVQFMHSYEMDWPTFALVGRTFDRVFPSGVLVVTAPGGQGGDYLLVGFKGSSGLILDHATRNLPYAQQSKNIALSDPALLYRLIVSEDLSALFGPGPINTDSRPLLEYAAPKLMHHDDTTITGIIQQKKWLSPATREIVHTVTTDIDMQIDFAGYALALHAPFEHMVHLNKASPSQEERFFMLMETFCRNNMLDALILKDSDLARRCRLAQIEFLRNRLDSLPDKIHSYTYLGTLYQDENMFGEAIAMLQRVLQIEPDNAVAHHYIGTALLRQNRLDEAIVELTEALQLEPDYAGAHNSLGRALMTQGKLQEALACFQDALRMDPDYVKASRNLAVVLAQLDRPDESIEQYQKALEQDPGNPDLYNEFGLLLYRQGKREQANQLFARAQQLRPDAPNIHVGLARILVREGKLEQAARAYGQAIEKAPDDADIHSELGFVWARLGRFDQAVIHLEKAIQIKPSLTETHVNLASILTLQDRFDQAIQHLEKALTINPDLTDAHLNLARIYRHQNRLPEAIKHLTEILKITPDSAQVHADLGRMYLEQNQLSQAMIHLKKTLKIEPDQTGPMRDLAWVLATHKEAGVRQPKEAIRLAKRACELTNHQRPDLLDTLATAYAAAGRFSEAVIAAEKALKLARSPEFKQLAESIQNRLLLFKTGRQYVDE